ncbi:MAG: PepSY domain-containing protein [Bacteroidales bacterium]|nr:PepSY domain-containing protein [Bacteroidales bacterium]
MQKSPFFKAAKTIRLFRKLHRYSGLVLMAFILNIAITGILLGWKKDSMGLLLPRTQKGISTDLADWQSLDSLKNAAILALHQDISPDLSAEIDRIDVRQQQGIVKFVFKNHYWGVQLDGATAAVLQIKKRRSDFLEHLHDGSLLDHYFDLETEVFKLLFTTVMGLAFILFTLTGFWIWYKPRQIRKAKLMRKSTNA